VKIPWTPDWHDEVVEILQSKTLELRHEGIEFFMEDSQGKRFKGTSRHCQEKERFPLTLYIKRRPAWQDPRNLMQIATGHVNLNNGVLRPKSEVYWTLLHNDHPRGAFMARNVKERGFLVDHLMDLIQRCSTCRCENASALGGADGASTELEDTSRSSFSDDVRKTVPVGHRCASRCVHCEGTCDCDWKNPLKRLIEERAEVNGRNWQGQTPLMVAAGHGHVRAVVFLLTMKADPMASADPEGWTPLHEAVRMGRSGTCDVLLEANSEDLEARCRKAEAYFCQSTPAIIAAEGGHLESLKVLMKYNANIDARREDGNNLLMLAAAGGHYEVCRYLLRSSCLVCAGLRGAMLKAAVDAGRPFGGCRGKCQSLSHLPMRNKRGKTTAMMARHELRKHKNYHEIARLLELKGVQ